MKRIFNIILWIVSLFKRDPEVLRQKDQNEIDTAVANLDGDAVNQQLSDSIGRLQDKGDRNSG